MSSLSFALDARVSWALYQIALTAGNQDAADDHYLEAVMGAQASGGLALQENSPLPHLLADVRSLAVEWAYGWNSSIELAEMADCWECNNDTGNPCSTHG